MKMTLVKLMGLNLPAGFREGEFEPRVKGVFLNLGEKRLAEARATGIGKSLLRLIEGLPGNKEALDAKDWLSTVVYGGGKSEFWLIPDYSPERFQAFLSAPTPKDEEKACACPLCRLERAVAKALESEARSMMTQEGVSPELQDRIIEVVDPKQFADVFKEGMRMTLEGLLG